MDDVKTSKEEFTGIEWPDYLVIAAYFIFVLIVGLIVSFFFFLLECLHIFTSDGITASVFENMVNRLLFSNNRLTKWLWLFKKCVTYL